MKKTLYKGRPPKSPLKRTVHISARIPNELHKKARHLNVNINRALVSGLQTAVAWMEQLEQLTNPKEAELTQLLAKYHNALSSGDKITTEKIKNQIRRNHSWYYKLIVDYEQWVAENPEQYQKQCEE